MGIKEIEFFKKISDYFWQMTKKDYSLICPKHRIEHTGKNVYSVIIDIKLFQITKEEKYFVRAKQRVLRTIGKLIPDPDFGYFIFHPGRLGRWNMSNSVIDSGACVDVLSSFYLDFFGSLDTKEKAALKDTIFKNCDSYLQTAVITKEITNQRLWGGTGLARAYQIFGKEEWRNSLIKSIEKSLKEMWGDGTFPYHSYWKEYKIHQGIYDTTVFYHSRCIAFIYYILENIKENLEKYKEKLLRAADLLVAMYQPNGIKNINLECKRWYWNSSYEIASNAFDIYALIKSYELTKNELYAYYARKSLKQILRHQLSDKGIDSHLNEPQNNFQCRIFWNSNLSWLVKIIDKLPPSYAKDEIREFHYFENSDILKFKNKNYNCILRGRKQPMSLMWGPAIGGGSMLCFGMKNNGWEDIFQLKPWQENIPGNFSFELKENYFKNLKEFLAENKKDVRSKIYHALVELRTPDLKSFSFLLLNLFKMLIESGRGVYTSQWANEAILEKKENEITFKVIPAKRNGKKLNGVRIKRNYFFKDNEISVKENIFIENGEIRKIKYNKFPNSIDFKIITDLMRKETKQDISFYLKTSKSYLEISYSLKS